MLGENHTTWELHAVIKDGLEIKMRIGADPSMSRQRIKEILMETQPVIEKITSLKKSKSQKNKLSVA